MQCELSFSRSSSISSISNASTFASATSPLPSDAGGSSEPSRQACKKSLEVTYNGYEGCGWAQCMANIFGESRLYDHILKVSLLYNLKLIECPSMNNTIIQFLLSLFTLKSMTASYTIIPPPHSRSNYRIRADI